MNMGIYNLNEDLICCPFCGKYLEWVGFDRDEKGIKNLYKKCECEKSTQTTCKKYSQMLEKRKGFMKEL